jgi:hypothetical protein
MDCCSQLDERRHHQQIELSLVDSQLAPLQSTTTTPQTTTTPTIYSIHTEAKICCDFKMMTTTHNNTNINDDNSTTGTTRRHSCSIISSRPSSSSSSFITNLLLVVGIVMTVMTPSTTYGVDAIPLLGGRYQTITDVSDYLNLALDAAAMKESTDLTTKKSIYQNVSKMKSRL